MEKKIVRIGMFGLGVVASGVLKLLEENQAIIKKRCNKTFKVTKIVVKNKNKKRLIPAKILKGIKISDDPQTIFNDPDIDVILELIGGKGLAKKIFLYCTEKQKPLVSANKAFLAEDSHILADFFKKKRTCLGMEASVAASVPILQSLRYGISANEISTVYGIINGTANYILSAMEKRDISFNQALIEAQKLGFAEQDPTFDIKGHDSAHKLAILMSLAFHHRFNYKEISKEGIEHIDPLDFHFAKEFGYCIKLLGIAKKTKNGYEGRVHPTFIPKGSMLASVHGVYNAIYVEGNYSGPLVIYGLGAGSKPTASAVISDLIGMFEYEDILSTIHVPEEKYFFEQPPKGIIPLEKIVSKFYVRLRALDSIGVMTKISKVISQNKISISQMIQKRVKNDSNKVDLIIITNTCLENNMNKALQSISKEKFVYTPCHHYRIEDNINE